MPVHQLWILHCSSLKLMRHSCCFWHRYSEICVVRMLKLTVQHSYIQRNLKGIIVLCCRSVGKGFMQDDMFTAVSWQRAQKTLLVIKYIHNINRNETMIPNMNISYAENTLGLGSLKCGLNSPVSFRRRLLCSRTTHQHQHSGTTSYPHSVHAARVYVLHSE